MLGRGGAHEALSPEAIRENERYFAEEVLPARLDQLAPRFQGEWRGLCERAIPSWANLFIQRIAAGTGLTLVQGDAQLGNRLLPRDPLRHRPVIIDWEGVTRGIGVWDLGRTLIQTGLPSHERQELERIVLPRYQAHLTECGIQDYSLEDCLADYSLCVVDIAEPGVAHILKRFSRRAAAGTLRSQPGRRPLAR